MIAHASHPIVHILFDIFLPYPWTRTCGHGGALSECSLSDFVDILEPASYLAGLYVVFSGYFSFTPCTTFHGNFKFHAVGVEVALLSHVVAGL